MPAILEVESSLTDRYQTTVPETVRDVLKLGKRDKIHYTIRSSGEVVLTRATALQGDDPMLGQFLGFLASDIAAHPERLQSVDAGLVRRLQTLVGDIAVDFDAESVSLEAIEAAVREEGYEVAGHHVFGD